MYCTPVTSWGTVSENSAHLRHFVHFGHLLGWFGVISGHQYPKLDMVDPKVHVGGTASPSGALTPHWEALVGHVWCPKCTFWPPYAPILTNVWVLGEVVGHSLVHGGYGKSQAPLDCHWSTMGACTVPL